MAKKYVDPNRLCMGCMKIVADPYKKCPHCAFEINKYKMPEMGIPLYEILNGKYLVGRVLGVGGFGITYVGWNLFQNKRVCIKEYFPRDVACRKLGVSDSIQRNYVTVTCSEATYAKTGEIAQVIYNKGLEMVMKEAETLTRFYLMPGIVSVRDFFRSNRTAYIVMEYIDGINLKDYATQKGGRLSLEEILGRLSDVIKAMHAVHKEQILHLDISPDNIMIERSGKCKLIDFGASRDLSKMKAKALFLKPGFAPIEQYRESAALGPWSDVYSMAATIYYLFTGKKVPEARDREENDTFRSPGQEGYPIPAHIDQAITDALCMDHRHRIQNFSEFYHAIYGVYL